MPIELCNTLYSIKNVRPSNITKSEGLDWSDPLFIFIEGLTDMKGLGASIAKRYLKTDKL